MGAVSLREGCLQEQEGKPDRDKEEQERGTGLTAGARREFSAGLQQSLCSVGLAMTSQQWGTGNLHPAVFFYIFDLASWKLRAIWRLILSLSSQQNLWNQTGTCLRCRHHRDPTGLATGTSCHFYTPVISILSETNYIPVWCCWLWYPCTTSNLGPVPREKAHMKGK